MPRADRTQAAEYQGRSTLLLGWLTPPPGRQPGLGNGPGLRPSAGPFFVHYPTAVSEPGKNLLHANTGVCKLVCCSAMSWG